MEVFSSKDSLSKQIDNFFNQKKPNEQKILYLLIGAVVAYLVYQFVYMRVDMLRKDAYSKVLNMRTEVNTKQTYLSTNTNANLVRLRKNVKNLEKEYDNSLYKISYVDNTLSELSYLLFNDENWAKFVDNISFLAKKYHLNITKISNKFYQPSFQKVSQVVTIEVDAKSSYKNMMKFLNKIEESKLVVDVSDLNISQPSDELDGHFKISVWGMKY